MTFPIKLPTLVHKLCLSEKMQSSERTLIIQEEMIMSLTELFIIAVGLSMDAFAVAVCKGLAWGK